MLAAFTGNPSMISATHATTAVLDIDTMSGVVAYRGGNARTGVDPIAIDSVGVTWVRRSPTSFAKFGCKRPEQG